MVLGQAVLLNSPRRFIMARRCARLPVTGPETEFASTEFASLGASVGAGDMASLSACLAFAAAVGVRGSVFFNLASVSV
jgi:hypothetical protein